MRFLALAVLLASGLLSTPTSALPQQRAKQPKKVWTNKDLEALRGRPSAKKVWTNDDLEALHGRPGVTVMSRSLPEESRDEQVAPTAEQGAPTTPSSAKKPYFKEKDPNWYRQQLEPLRAEVEAIDEQIRQLRNTVNSGRTQGGGVVLGRDYVLDPPQERAQVLATRKIGLLNKIGALEDLARRNGIAPGEIR